MSARAALASKTKARAGVWATGIAAVVMVGTLTGATLKQDKQKEETIRQFRETDPEEQIAALEGRKALLIEQRQMLQRKVDVFQERVKEREEEKRIRREKAALKAAERAERSSSR